ncbi:sigma-54 interaction domain-containing protein [Alteribacillus iranensis]|uniref:HTH-type transcriptional regulatory protein TyrR n=1 Tax=Alteribacillus iranensis TaxID=930128 RepID=A0A1I2E3N6_9BACI|nr:sigma 54-interacting transcriptional regulator [Alteribacillus iranensis]SFE87279.1 PAS domain S-box-containing protein/intein N-terminal splicing region [Alteribacillus iranensis]
MIYTKDESERILESLQDDLLVTDVSGTITKVTHTMKKLYGVENDELVGQSVYDLEKAGIFKPAVTPMVKKNKKRTTIIQTTNDNKKLLVTGIPVFDDNGDLWRIATYSHDVTELVNIKDYLSEMEEEMERVLYELNRLRGQYLQEYGFIARSSTMKRCLEMARQVADVDVNVLLLGESGVGKTQIAKMVHKESPRKDGPFIEVNCGAIPETLFESEFFGYAGGTFTGSNKNGKVGLAELAEGGTLFLDEVGELSLNNQVKVLKFIQEKEFYPVGGRKSKKVDFRLISATNRPLEKLVQEDKFREDLFFRLNVVPITIPPLRERTPDIIPLIEHFVQEFSEKYEREIQLEKGAMKLLSEHDWRGNVRELMNVIERLIVTTPSNVLKPEDIWMPNKSTDQQDKFSFQGSLPETLASVEEKIIKEAASQCRTTTEMAEWLGISQPSVVRKLKKYNIK